MNKETDPWEFTIGYTGYEKTLMSKAHNLLNFINSPTMKFKIAQMFLMSYNAEPNTVKFKLVREVSE